MAPRSASASRASMPCSAPEASCQARGAAKRHATRGGSTSSRRPRDAGDAGHDAMRRSPNRSRTAPVGASGGGGGSSFSRGAFSFWRAGDSGRFLASRSALRARFRLSSSLSCSTSSGVADVPSSILAKASPMFWPSSWNSRQPASRSRAQSPVSRVCSKSSSSRAPFLATRRRAAPRAARAPRPQGGPSAEPRRLSDARPASHESARSSRPAARGPRPFCARDRYRSRPRHRTHGTQPPTTRGASSPASRPINASKV
mmetsp:Transcript_8302/g.24904  ORF Transcript_8302/g.24904 Transcript_8302/m.24904 type:complete len:258 (-) Transcript_8302:917-1690(-)